LGYTTRPVEAALDSAVKWYEANGYVRASRGKAALHARAAA